MSSFWEKPAMSDHTASHAMPDRYKIRPPYMSPSRPKMRSVHAIVNEKAEAGQTREDVGIDRSSASVGMMTTKPETKYSYGMMNELA